MAIFDAPTKAEVEQALARVHGPQKFEEVA